MISRTDAGSVRYDRSYTARMNPKKPQQDVEAFFVLCSVIQLYVQRLYTSNWKPKSISHAAWPPRIPQFCNGLSRSKIKIWSAGIPNVIKFCTKLWYKRRFAVKERPAKQSILICVNSAGCAKPSNTWKRCGACTHKRILRSVWGSWKLCCTASKTVFNNACSCASLY